jgi:hypothetical protein
LSVSNQNFVRSSGPPESVRNCEITNKSLTIVSVQCSAGNNGGLQQTFYLEIYKTGSEQLHSNQSSSQPLFIVNNLIPKTHYRFAIYSANPKGRSNSITYTSVIIDSEEEKIAKGINNLFIEIFFEQNLSLNND